MSKEELKIAICDMNCWRKIFVGARKNMWRYSGPLGTILLADMSSPPYNLNAEEFLKRLWLWPK